MRLSGCGSAGEGNARQGTLRLSRSRFRRLGENCAPFVIPAPHYVIPAQAGIQRGSGGSGRLPARRTRDLYHVAI